MWRGRSSGRRDGSGRRAVSPPAKSWSSRLAASRHISVCTCVPVCLHLGVRACAFMCVCVCLRVHACARGEPPSPRADVRSAGEGGHRLGGASAWLRSGEPTAAATRQIHRFVPARGQRGPSCQAQTPVLRPRGTPPRPRVSAARWLRTVAEQ